MNVVDTTMDVSMSVFEVYQERIRDLLQPSNLNLRIREDKYTLRLCIRIAIYIYKYIYLCVRNLR
jgi:hypothetical protein